MVQSGAVQTASPPELEPDDSPSPLELEESPPVELDVSAPPEDEPSPVLVPSEVVRSPLEDDVCGPPVDDPSAPPLEDPPSVPLALDVSSPQAGMIARRRSRRGASRVIRGT